MEIVNKHIPKHRYMWRSIVEYVVFWPPRPTYNREFVSITGTPLRFLEDIPILEYVVDPTLPWILYSHGMRCDIGKMDHHITSLSLALGINILSYDFPGYGCCPGRPSEQASYRAIEMVYAYLIERGATQIFLYGVSLGTGPTIELATRVKVAGVILRSPFLSLGIFHNLAKMDLITAPIYCIHGNKDWLVPVIHSMALCNRVKGDCTRLYLPGGHGDLMKCCKAEIVEGIRGFLKVCLAGAT